MKSLKSQNFYEVLGVPRHATAEEIRAAYEISRHTFQENSLATYSLFTDAENQEILALIAKAYETLSNPETRRAYDAQLERQEAEARPPRRPASTPGAHLQAQTAAGAPIPAQTGGGRRPVEGLGMAPPLGAISPPGLPPAPSPVPPPAPEARPDPSRVLSREPNPQAAEFAKSITCCDGASLKKLRQLHNISLEELSERTKIRRTYLEYLEEEQFQFLPAAVYVKGFVSIIASILGLSPQRAAEEYMKRYYGRER